MKTEDNDTTPANAGNPEGALIRPGMLVYRFDDENSSGGLRVLAVTAGYAVMRSDEDGSIDVEQWANLSTLFVAPDPAWIGRRPDGEPWPTEVETILNAIAHDDLDAVEDAVERVEAGVDRLASDHGDATALAATEQAMTDLKRLVLRCVPTAA